MRVKWNEWGVLFIRRFGVGRAWKLCVSFPMGEDGVCVFRCQDGFCSGSVEVILENGRFLGELSFVLKFQVCNTYIS